MQKIGEGFYYQVYDLGHGRVKKIRNGHRVMFRKLMAWYGTSRLKRLKRFLGYPYYAHLAKRSLTLSVSVAKQNPAMTGNPVFFGRYEYEQDKAEILETYFKNHSIDECKRVFDQYVEQLKTLWTQGLSDTVFNFTINNGVSLKSGQVIFIDFNEFTTSKTVAQEDIRNQKWLTQASLLGMPDGDLRKYIVEKMNSEITLVALEKNWRRPR